MAEETKRDPEHSGQGQGEGDIGRAPDLDGSLPGHGPEPINSAGLEEKIVISSDLGSGSIFVSQKMVPDPLSHLKGRAPFPPEKEPVPNPLHPPSQETPLSDENKKVVEDGCFGGLRPDGAKDGPFEASAKEGVKEGPRRGLHVKVQVYDGPLDLLLDLIKKNEMNIYDIPIAEITKQYLEYLEQMKKLDLEVAGEFIVMAATLIYIKSKTLLPTEKEGEEDGEDPRAELVRKLLEYQAFKEAAKELGFLQTERGKMFTRQVTGHYLGEITAEDAGVDTFSANFFDLVVAFQNVLTKKERERPHEVFEEVISIEEKMIEIQSLLTEKKKVKFSELFTENWSRNELVAIFLAVLEIIRTRFAKVFQDKAFDEIVIEKKEEPVHNSDSVKSETQL